MFLEHIIMQVVVQVTRHQAQPFLTAAGALVDTSFLDRLDRQKLGACPGGLISGVLKGHRCNPIPVPES